MTITRVRAIRRAMKAARPGREFRNLRRLLALAIGDLRRRRAARHEEGSR